MIGIIDRDDILIFLILGSSQDEGFTTKDAQGAEVYLSVDSGQWQVISSQMLHSEVACLEAVWQS